MPNVPDLGPATRVVAALVPQVQDTQLQDPTPCEDYRVQDLLFHLLGLSTAFRDAARKDLGPNTQTPPEQSQGALPEDWRDRLPERLSELADAWRSPAAWEGETQAGGVTLPATAAGLFALDEVVVHGWDLAAATGQSYEADQTSLQVVFDFLEPQQNAERPPIFGQVVPVAPDAPLLHRVLGLAGRRPDWTGQ